MDQVTLLRLPVIFYGHKSVDDGCYYWVSHNSFVLSQIPQQQDYLPMRAPSPILEPYPRKFRTNKLTANEMKIFIFLRKNFQHIRPIM